MTVKSLTFSTSYRGTPEAAVEVLLHPESFAKAMPYVRRVEVLKRPTHDSLIASWEVEIDGARLSWREESQLVRAQQMVRFQMVKGDFQAYSGEWTITTQDDQVTVTLRADLDWGAPNLNQFVSQILHQKAERALRGMVLTVGRMAFRRSLELNRASRRFGFIFHPLDLGLLADGFGDQDLKSRRPALLEQVLPWFPPFRRAVVNGIRSPLGVEVEGDMILCPLLPKQMLMLDDQFVLSRLVEAGRLAERYGDKIVGLGAYAATVGHKGIFLGRQLRVPVTTGSSYTVAVALEATLKASQAVGLRLTEATVAVVGATGTIGRVCAYLMAKEARHVVLVARNQQRLEDLAQALTDQGEATISALSDLDSAVSNADIVIASTSTPVAIIDVSKLKPGAVVCDISRPRNVPEENAMLRPDVLVLDGGVVRPPGNPDFHFSFGLESGLAYACIAETMILALEGRYESYSLGGDVDVAKVREIALMGRKHGFAFAGLRSFDRQISEDQIGRIQESRTKSRRRRPSLPAPLRGAS